MAGIDGPIITTGDNVYETGTLAEFNACYEPTWGPFKARTRPVPGNHDWGNGVRTPASLTDYFTYFGANANAGGTSYYSYDLDANWHVVNLDSECANVPGGGCAAGSTSTTGWSPTWPRTPRRTSSPCGTSRGSARARPTSSRCPTW